MVLQISPMGMKHFYDIEEILSTEFDDFWSSSILKDELQNSNSQYFVALINGVVVGFAGIWKAVNEYHITNIAVKKDMRRKGIGSSLLEKLIEVVKSKNIDSITLEVNCKNLSAIELYKKYNFKQVGIRKKYYNQTDDALIMTLFLN